MKQNATPIGKTIKQISARTDNQVRHRNKQKSSNDNPVLVLLMSSSILFEFLTTPFAHEGDSKFPFVKSQFLFHGIPKSVQLAHLSSKFTVSSACSHSTEAILYQYAKEKESWKEDLAECSSLFYLSWREWRRNLSKGPKSSSTQSPINVKDFGV